jgi:acyl-coenzyme A synthetase/AMP-(fatty) acid ligase
VKEFPRTASGKVQKYVLREMLGDKTPNVKNASS